MLLADLSHAKVIGHRGACAYAPENTLASFTKAVELGIKWIEFDVMLAACGTPVIIHDDTLERTTNGHGMVDEHSYDDLQRLDAGSWFNPDYRGQVIPTLISVVKQFFKEDMSFNVEIKTRPGKEEMAVKRVISELSPYLESANHRFLFSSFSQEALLALRHYGPSINIGILLHEWVSGWEALTHALTCTSVHVNHEILTHDLAQHIRSSDLALLSYTVNSPERANELYSMGVDAVFSDYPDIIYRNSVSI